MDTEEEEEDIRPMSMDREEDIGVVGMKEEEEEDIRPMSMDREEDIGVVGMNTEEEEKGSLVGDDGKMEETLSLSLSLSLSDQ